MFILYISFNATFSEVIYFFRKFISIRKVGKVEEEKWRAGSFSAIANLIICVSKNVRCVTLNDDTDFPLKLIC